MTNTPASNVTQLRPAVKPERKHNERATDRAEPTVQLCLNDDELQALQELLESVPIVQNYRVMSVLLDIRNGNYITLDRDED